MMAGQLEQRLCGRALRGAHPEHLYMQNCYAYRCPGGDTMPDVPIDTSCGVVHLDAHGRIVQCPTARGPGPEPGEPPTDAERIRDLEHTLQRAREVLGTDAVLVGCEEHEARITALEDALRDVLNTFIEDTHPGQPCKRSRHVDLATLGQWHAVLRGEA